jgi:hypothetical protein
LRFLNTQYLHKLRDIEKESKDKSKKNSWTAREKFPSCHSNSRRQ